MNSFDNANKQIMMFINFQKSTNLVEREAYMIFLEIKIGLRLKIHFLIRKHI